MARIELAARLFLLPFSRSIPSRLLEDNPGLEFCVLLMSSSSLVSIVIIEVAATGTVDLLTPITGPILLTLLMLLFIRFVEYFGRKIWDVQKDLYDEFLYSFSLTFALYIGVSLLAMLIGPTIPSFILRIIDMYFLLVAALVIKVLADVSLIKSFVTLLIGSLAAFPAACYVYDLLVNMSYFMERLGA